jgi:DNA-binding NtrC family response regulator
MSVQVLTGQHARSNRRPARVVVVLRDRALAEIAASTLIAHGIEAVAFGRPTIALQELEQSRTTDVLVTSADFAPGYPKGISLARVTRRRRPLLKVIFVDRPEVAEDVAGESNDFVPTPVTGLEVARAVARLIQRRL